MRWARVLLVPALVLLFVACSSSDDGDGDNGGGDSTTATAAATTESGSGDGGSGGASSSGGAGASGGTTLTGSGDVLTKEDVERLSGELAPPNASESTRLTADEGVTVTYESSDSVDSLKEFYDNRLQELGIHVQGTFSAENTHTMAIGDDSGDGLQGGITIGPLDSGGSVVVLTLLTPS